MKKLCYVGYYDGSDNHHENRKCVPDATNKMNTVATLTFHWAANYGAVLQSYALQVFLRKVGIQSEIADYVPFRVHFRQLLSFIYHQEWSSLKKQNELEKFRDKKLVLSSKKYRSNKDLLSHKNHYSAIICGSDQIWNMWFTLCAEKRPTLSYFLNFADDSVRRIAYGVSFGTDKVTEEYIQTVLAEVKKFHAISVREKAGMDIVKKLGRQAELVCDPVFLLGMDDYKELFKRIDIPFKSVFSYILHKNQPLANELLSYVQKLYHAEKRDGDVCCSMEAWLYQIANAEIVVTNSFHGVALSIILHTPFVVAPVFGANMNNRILTLLESVGLIDRYIEEYDEYAIEKICKSPIDWLEVDDRVNEMRRVSAKFLLDNLENLG